MRRCLCIFFCCLLLLASPIRLLAFSVQEERELGQKLLSLVRRQFKVLDDPDLTQYISGLGNELLAQVGPRYFDYHFFIVASREFNAFAAPSGLIFLNSGLIEATHTEDELASVLAHEIGHVRQRHIARRIAKNKKVSLGTAALMIIGAAVGGGPLGEALITGSMAAGQSLNLYFSRKDEEEADRLAYAWMRADHRDPRAMLSMIRTMQRLAKYRSDQPPPYLLTHPEPQRRAGYIRDLLSALPADPAPPPRDEFAFQRFRARVLALTEDLARRRQRYRRLQDPVWSAYGLALVAMDEARYDEAERLLAKVRQRYADQPILDADLARIAYARRDLRRARKLLEEARRRAPADLYILWLLARIEESTGAQEAAAALYEQLVAALPDYPEPYLRLARLHSAAGRRGKGLYFLAYSFWLSGNEKRAKETAEQAVQAATGATRQKAEELLAVIERLEKKF